jgi:hypothetical protein
MDNHVNEFITHAIKNLEAALEKQEDKFAWAVLTNLSGVVDSYIEALELKLS